MPADDLTIKPDFVFEEEIEFNTLVSRFENGTEQRRSQWANPRRRFKLEFRNRPSSDLAAVRTLFVSKKGALGSFFWTNPNDSVQYTVRFETDGLSSKNKAFGIYDFELSLLEVK